MRPDFHDILLLKQHIYSRLNAEVDIGNQLSFIMPDIKRFVKM